MKAGSPPLPLLHLLVGDDLLATDADNLARCLEPVLAAGGPALALHLRARRTSVRSLHDSALVAVALARPQGVPVVVNDRLDVALAVDAAGVHLREDSLPPQLVRRIAGPTLLLGRSLHHPAQLLPKASAHRAAAPDAAEIEAAAIDTVASAPCTTEAQPEPPIDPRSEPLAAPDLGALDYLVLGAIYPTRSHPDRAPLGTARLAQVARASDRPVVAIGGVTPERVAELRGCGATGVAVRSGVWGAEQPARAAERYLEALVR